MHWYEWVFSGVGVAVIVYLIQLWVNSGKKEGANLTTQGAKVIGSPVASGDNINQQVNAPIIQHAENVNIGSPVPPQQPAPIPPAPVAPEPNEIRPRSPAERTQLNMVMTGARLCRVAQVDHGVWSENHAVDSLSPRRSISAFVVQFTNEAQRDIRDVGGLVKAHLFFRDGDTELRRMTGCWLNEAADMTEFRVDETHFLLIGIIMGQQLTTIDKRRVYVDLTTDEVHSDVNVLANFHGVTVFVRLIHTNSCELLYEGRFRLSVAPIGIAEVRG